MPVRYLKLAVTLCLLLATVFLYQNCSQPAATKGKNTAKSIGEKLAFAYDAHFDQVAYMSCQAMPLSSTTGSQYNKSTYFTFRAGAYRSGGLLLKEDFFATLSKKTPDRMQEYLGESSLHKSTVLQFALRPNNSFQALMTGSGAEKPGDDFENMLGELGTDEMNKLLINYPAGKRVKYIRNGDVKGARIEGSLHFGSSSNLQASVRDALKNGALLSMTYSNRTGAGRETGARSPSTVEGEPIAENQRSVYGVGLSLDFRVPELRTHFDKTYPGTYGDGVVQTVLSTVTEKNLVNQNDRTSVGTWVCPGEMRYRIVLLEDAKTAGCATEPDPIDMATNPNHFYLSLARNTLRSEDWFIDSSNLCIVPKKADGKSCYGDNRYVEYDLTKVCSPAPATNSLTNKMCASYASICYRR